MEKLLFSFRKVHFNRSLSTLSYSFLLMSGLNAKCLHSRSDLMWCFLGSGSPAPLNSATSSSSTMTNLFRLGRFRPKLIWAPASGTQFSSSFNRLHVKWIITFVIEWKWEQKPVVLFDMYYILEWFQWAHLNSSEQKPKSPWYCDLALCTVLCWWRVYIYIDGWCQAKRRTTFVWPWIIMKMWSGQPSQQTLQHTICFNGQYGSSSTARIRFRIVVARVSITSARITQYQRVNAFMRVLKDKSTPIPNVY